MDPIGGTAVEDGGNRSTRLSQGQSGAVSIVIVRRNNGSRSSPHAIAAQIGAHGSGQHNAGKVVTFKQAGPLERAGRKDHLACSHAPQSLGQTIGAGSLTGLGQALNKIDQIMIVVARCRGAGQDTPTGRDQALTRLGNPLVRRQTINGRWVGQERATEALILLGQDHPRTRRAGRKGCG